MPSEAVRRYQRLLDEGRLRRLSVCRTVCGPSERDLSVDDVMTAVGVDPAAAQLVDVGARLTEHPDQGLLCVERTAGAITVTEFRSVRCVHPPLLGRLSAGAQVSTVAWAADPPSGVCGLAVNGTVAGLDALHPDRRVGPAGDQLADAAQVLRPVLADPDGCWPAALLAALEHRTGVALDTDWFRRPHRGLPVPAATDQPVGWALLTGVDRTLEDQVDGCSGPQRQTVLRWLVSRLAAAFQLWQEPAVGAVVDALKDGFPTHDVYSDVVALLRERLEAEFRTQSTNHPEARRFRWQRMQAALAIESAAASHRLRATGIQYALRHTQLALGDQWPAARAEIIMLLGGPFRPRS